jgi:hypothetical protein
MFNNTGGFSMGRNTTIHDNGLQMRRYMNNELGWGPGSVPSEGGAVATGTIRCYMDGQAASKAMQLRANDMPWKEALHHTMLSELGRTEEAETFMSEYNARRSNPTSSLSNFYRLLNLARAADGEPPLLVPSSNVSQMQEDDGDAVSIASTTDSDMSGMMTPSTDSESEGGVRTPPMEANDMESTGTEMSGMMTPSTVTESESGAMTPTTVEGDVEPAQMPHPPPMPAFSGPIFSGRRVGFGASDTRGTVSFTEPNGVWRTVPVRDDGMVESRDGLTITHPPGMRTYMEEIGLLPRSQDSEAAED